MNIMFLVFHGFEANSGITKKIHNQVRALQQLGHKVHLCYYGFDENLHRVRWVDSTAIADYGNGPLAPLRARIGLHKIADWAVMNGIEIVYARSFHNASPLTIRLFRTLRRSGIKVALEIPTYPYDQEYVGFPLGTRLKLLIDRCFRRTLAKEVSAIVTFADVPTIFGQRTICISNGVDFEALPLIAPRPNSDSSHPIVLTAVAEVHYWHGLDRLLTGLGEYFSGNSKRDIRFNIVGGVGPSEMHDSQHAPGFAEIIEHYGIADKVVFHGQLFGDALTEVFNHTDLCIGSLARHRSGVQSIKTLKNREYAARGLAFVYSESDSDFDNKPYVLRVPADETPICIQDLLNFLDRLTIKPEEIRQSISNLSWREQMRRVVDEL